MHPTLLLGLDGATFTILDPLMKNGTMPFLKSLVDHGVRAQLLSTANPLTPPAWISMITGRNPGNHGVFDFIWADQHKADPYFTLYNFRDIRCETIWSMVSRQNGRAGSLNFTMMSPPPAINGYIIPGLVSWKHMRRNVFPRELYEELKVQPFFNVKELAWDFELEKKAEQGIHKDEYQNWVRFHIRRERQWFDVMTFLMKNHPCDLTAILFDGSDKIFHMGWRFLDPASPVNEFDAWELEIRELCLDFFRALDDFLRGIVELADLKARIFLASDHGFGPSWFAFRVNAWLCEQGYLSWKNLENLTGNEQEKAKKVVDKHFVLLDWEKTTAYARSVTSNGIYIRKAGRPGENSVPAEEYDAFRRKLSEKLLAIREPLSDKPIIKKIMTREEAYPGTHNDQAPDLTLVMEDYGFISILNKFPIIARRPEIAGTHYPEGIFLAHGPGIRQNECLKDLSIMDVTPILLYSLGLDIPSNLEGRLPTEIFTKDFVADHPPRIGEPTLVPDTFLPEEKQQQTTEGDDEQLIFEQMRALGYIE